MLPARIKDAETPLILREQACQRFTLAEIHLATRNFDEELVIGRGGFGKVYRSQNIIWPTKEIAIKRLNSMSNQGTSEFEAEIQVLSMFWHNNLLSLIGYCSEGEEMILVYEYMPNGTLEDHLRKGIYNLSWLKRLEICTGAAHGLHYLHTGTPTKDGVIHRDVKTSNILLDAHFVAKISDFGLAKVGLINHLANQTKSHVSTAVKGTFGYMDPCYFHSGKITRKTDVYAFGVVLLEVLTGRKAVDPTLDEEQWSLAAWATGHIKDGKLNKIIDSRLKKGHISKKSLKDFATIAWQCLHDQPRHRPNMEEIVVKLESILSQEKKSSDSGVGDGRLINKVISFLTAKADTSPDCVLGSKSDIHKSINQSFRIYTYAELKSATNNFKHKMHSPTLHETIYKGWVDETTYVPTERGVGLEMYVRQKHIGMSKLDLKPTEFDHPNLVKLLGYCLDAQELYSVYELLPDISLDKCLFREPGRSSLPWVARLKIAIGAAQGLSFLHQRKHMAFSQFKTSVILVDMDFNARLSGFEVEMSFLLQDSYSFHIDAFYAAPEWFSYQVSMFEGYRYGVSKYEEGFGVTSEIYSFGVILLEILTGQKVYDVTRPLGKQNLVKLVTPLLAQELNLGMIIDPKLQHDSYLPKGSFKIAQLASQCLQSIDENRPSMERILNVLYQCYQEVTLSTY